MAVLHGMPVFGSKQSAICTQAVYFCIQQCLVSCACDWVM